MVSSYTANLAAFLTIETPKVLIENVDDLSVNKEGVVYGAKRTGSTRNFFMVISLTQYSYPSLQTHYTPTFTFTDF